MKCLPEDEENIAVAGAAHSREKGVFIMPGFDGTGPMGAGPMTGGSRGLCNPAYAGYGPVYGRGAGYGRGYGRGWGRGPGFRRGFGAGFGRGGGYGRGLWGRASYPAWGGAYAPTYGPYTMNPQDEASMLKEEANAIKQDLDAINKRLSELESNQPQSGS